MLEGYVPDQCISTGLNMNGVEVRCTNLKNPSTQLCPECMRYGFDPF